MFTTIESISEGHHYRRKILQSLNYAILIALAIIVLFPIYWMVSLSFQPTKEIFSWPLRFWPKIPTIKQYIDLYKQPGVHIGRWGLNSVITSISITVVTLFVTSLAAYAFARLQFPGRNFIFMVILFTLMVPRQVTMIPVYLIVRAFKWIDTYHAVIWPAVPNVFGLFLLRQFFLGIPSELEEAAVIDGAGRFRIYWQIVLPLSTNVLIAFTIFTFLNAWNDMFWPLIVLNKIDVRTLPVGLVVLHGSLSSGQLHQGMIMAGGVIASAPVLILYVFFQKQFLKGIALTGLGGR